MDDDRLLKKIRLDRLYDIYGPLLTEKQREVFMLHHERDLSLAEIADSLGMSRQGVHDLFQRSRERLEEIEDRLGCLERETRFAKALESVLYWCSGNGVTLPQELREDLEELAGFEGTGGTNRRNV